MQLRGLFFLGGHLVQAWVVGQSGVDEVGQGFDRLAQHKQGAGGRHRVGRLQGAGQRRGGQLGIVAGLAGIASGLFQCGAGLQAFDARLFAEALLANDAD